MTVGKPPSPPAIPRIDSRILIVSANVLGISVLQSARAGGFFNITVWERERSALDCRSVVRVIERHSATLVVGRHHNSQNGGHRVVAESWLHARGPFEVTIICDGLPLPDLRELFGEVIEPRHCKKRLGLNDDASLPMDDSLNAIRVLCGRPGIPITTHAMRVVDKREPFQVFVKSEDYEEDLDGVCYGLGDLADDDEGEPQAAEDQPA